MQWIWYKKGRLKTSMNTRKIVISILIILILGMNLMTAAAAPVSPRDWDRLTSRGELRSDAVNAQAAILMDAHTGKVLFGKRMHEKMNPASITKIMTALVAIERNNLSDIVTIDNQISEEIVKLKGSGAAMCGFQSGETLTVEELLYGLMLLSGADAAQALAVHTAGSYDEFIDMMNLKAEEIGMTNTYFENPHGLYDSLHRTTAYDMALLGQYAQRYPDFVKIVGTAKFTPTDTDKNHYSASGIVWTNSNKLITDDSTFGYDYATGVKTGYIKVAGHTLVSSAEKGELSLIAVVLNDTKNGKWTSSITMFEYGFEFWDTIDLSKMLGTKEIFEKVEKAASSTDGNELRMQMIPESKTYLTFPEAQIEEIRNNPDQFEERITYKTTPLVAPIERGDIVGKVEYFYQGELVFIADLMAANTVEAIPELKPETTEKPTNAFAPTETAVPDTPGGAVAQYAMYAIAGLTAILVVLIVLLVVTRRSKHQQYAHRKTPKRLASNAKHASLYDEAKERRRK